ELHAGFIYRDALSGYLVLVREAEVWERRAAAKVRVKRLVGWFWNPVWGKHAEMELHDHQLISAEHPTDLKADTRYDNGYHGK
ncbi:MAG TPA: hypothetical protein PKY96_18815, partial [Flavobacteriales bacterium]|nr:hypothetical protein [Flavobacteriales bacterium]